MGPIRPPLAHLAIIFAGGLVLNAAACASAEARPARGGSALARFSGQMQALSKKVSPAVVHITARNFTANSKGPGGGGLVAQQAGNGSGFIISSDGYIMTNAHVVGAASHVMVLIPAAKETGSSVLQARAEPVTAKVVGLDHETDLALLWVDVGDRRLPTLALADSDSVAQGQVAAAFGSPFGLEGTVSMGIISAAARQLKPDSPMVYVQTDAPVNPGNSGGPLVNLKGKVVGINSMIVSGGGGSDGIGFAIPANIVGTVYKQLRDHGRVRRGTIGVNAQTISPTMARAMELPDSARVILGDVYPFGPAALSGLEPGDVILKLDGKLMENGRQFDVNVYRRAAGVRVTLTVLRGGEEKTADVQVVERRDPAVLKAMADPRKNVVPEMGILGLNVDKQTAHLIPGLRERSGVIIAGSSAVAEYWQTAFRPGDVIRKINQEHIVDMEDLRAAAKKLKTGRPAVAHVERQGQMLFIVFTPKAAE